MSEEDKEFNLVPILVYIDNGRPCIQKIKTNNELKSLSRARLPKEESEILEALAREQSRIVNKKINKKDILRNGLSNLTKDSVLNSNKDIYVYKIKEIYFVYDNQKRVFIKISNDIENIIEYLYTKDSSLLYAIGIYNKDLLRNSLYLIDYYIESKIINTFLNEDISLLKFSNSVLKKGYDIGFSTGLNWYHYISRLGCLPLELLPTVNKLHYTYYSSRDFKYLAIDLNDISCFNFNINYVPYFSSVHIPLEEPKKQFNLKVGYEDIYNKIALDTDNKRSIIGKETIDALNSKELSEFIKKIEKDEFYVSYSNHLLYLLDFDDDYDEYDDINISDEDVIIREVDFFFTNGFPMYSLNDSPELGVTELTTLKEKNYILNIHSVFTDSIKQTELETGKYDKEYLDLFMSILIKNNQKVKSLDSIKEYIFKNKLISDDLCIINFLRLRKDLTSFFNRDSSLEINGTLVSIENELGKVITKNNFYLKGIY